MLEKRKKNNSSSRHRILLFSVLCLFVFCLLAQVNPTKKAEPKPAKSKVYLLHSDVLKKSPLNPDPDAQILVGNVTFRHDSADEVHVDGPVLPARLRRGAPSLRRSRRLDDPRTHEEVRKSILERRRALVAPLPRNTGRIFCCSLLSAREFRSFPGLFLCFFFVEAEGSDSTDPPRASLRRAPSMPDRNGALPAHKEKAAPERCKLGAAYERPKGARTDGLHPFAGRVRE